MREVTFKRVERFWRQHYSPSDSLLIDDCEYELLSGHGRRDDVTVFQLGRGAYVLVQNPDFGYLGLSYYDLDAEPEVHETLYHDEVEVLEPASEAFLQNDWDIESAFEGRGDPFNELPEEDVVQVLVDYLGDYLG